MSYIRVATGKGGSAKGYVWTGDHWDKDKTKAKVYRTYEEAYPEHLWGVKAGNIKIVDLNAQEEQKENQMTHEANLKLDAIKKLLEMHVVEQPKYEWQPAATAPRDGTPFLATVHSHPECVKFYEGEFVTTWDNDTVHNINNQKDWYWMPMPEMPQKESK